MNCVESVMIQPAINQFSHSRIDIHINPLSDEIQTVQIMKDLKLCKIEIRSFRSSPSLI